MSIHSQISPEVEATLAAQRRNSTIASLIVGILLMSLIALVFWYLKDLIYSNKTEAIVSYIPDEQVDEEVTAEKVTNEVKKTPAQPSSSAVSVIATTAASNISIPVPEVLVDSLSSDFGETEGFGEGFSNGFGSAGFGSGGGSTLFGKVGGQGGLVGKFYDLKRDKKKKLTSLGELYTTSRRRLPAYAKFIGESARKGFNPSDFNKYFVSKTKLSFTNLAMSQNTSALEAPKAFQAEDVEPSGWLVIYEGKIGGPSFGSDRVRFAGVFDDFVFVYINGKLVLNGSCIPANSFGLPEDKVKPGFHNRRSQPIKIGDWVDLRKTNDIKIVLGESPGGQMGGFLLIEQEGQKYDDDGAGGKKLPPFVTERLDSKTKARLSKIRNDKGKGFFPIELGKVPVFQVQ